MVDLESLRARLRALEDYRRRIARHAGVTRDEFIADTDRHDLAERHLHLAVECMLDIANHLAAEERWRQPGSYRDTFLILADNGVVERDLAQRLAGWAGLRNVLVHLYLGIDHGRIHDTIVSELGDLDAFGSALRTWLANRGG